MTDETPVPSPFVEPTAFDYEKYQDETTVKAIEAIFKIYGEFASALTNHSKDSPDTVVEKQSVVVQKIQEALVEYNVPDCDMQYLVDNIQAITTMLFRSISRQKNELEKELLARVMETRNPGDQHFSRDYASIGDLFLAVDKKRTEQKDDEHGYFYVTKK